jgi:serine/threonine protein phosphatase PrpC
MIYTWASATDKGLVRSNNEDAVAPRDMGIETAPFVVGVADGMGGHTGGEVASRIALDTALEMEGDVVARAEAANRAVLAAARRDPALTGMGTTLTLGSFGDDAVDIGHVGDSRAYLLRDGEIEQITTDHSLIAQMLARGEISPDEAAVHPYRSVITRAIGLESEVEVDRERRHLQIGDRVLFCSDGLSGMLDVDEIRDILTTEKHPTEAVWSPSAATSCTRLVGWMVGSEGSDEPTDRLLIASLPALGSGIVPIAGTELPSARRPRVHNLSLAMTTEVPMAGNVDLPNRTPSFDESTTAGLGRVADAALREVDAQIADIREAGSRR